MENQDQTIGTIGEYQDGLYRDIYEACELARHDDHVMSMMGKIWAKATILKILANRGVGDPFTDDWKQFASQIMKGTVSREPASHKISVLSSKETSLKQQAGAWLEICELLNEVSPGWLDKKKKAMQCALDAIRKMSSGSEQDSGLVAVGFEWKNSAGVWKFEGLHRSIAHYEQSGFETRYVYVKSEKSA